MTESGFSIPDVAESNLRYDRQNPNWRELACSTIRPGFREAMLLRRGPLTDKQISKYQAQGWYTAEFKEARRSLMDKKTAKTQAYLAKREGNFTLTNGRLVYNPV